MDPCSTRDQLQRLLLQQLDDRVRWAVEDHVQSCPACQQTLEELTEPRHEGAAWRPRSRDPEPSGPETSVLRWLRAQGPPRRDDDAASTHAECPVPDEASPAGRPRLLPTIAGYQLVRDVSHG